MAKQPNKGLNKMAFFLIPLGIAVNFIGGQIVVLLKLPIYLDSIGTMVVGALCGPVYSIIVALTTGLLMGITSPTSLFYLGNYLAVGLFAGLFAKAGWFNKLWKAVVFGIIIGVICGVCGSIVTVAVFGGYSASPTGIITGLIHKSTGISIPISNMISETFSDVIDKIPSAIATWLICKAIPNRFLLKLPLGGQYIRKSEAGAATAAE